MPDLSTAERTREFLLLCLNPGRGHPGRTVAKLAEVMPPWVAEPLAQHAPGVIEARDAAARAAAQAKQAAAQAARAHRVYADTLGAWLNNEPTPHPQPGQPAPVTVLVEVMVPEAVGKLIAEGHTNAEIGRRTGLDHRLIGGMRDAIGAAPATIRRPHPRRAEIVALMVQGLYDAEIMRRAGVGLLALRRIRDETGIPNPGPRVLSRHEKWQANVRPVPGDGGHLEWVGSHTKADGTPVMSHGGQCHSPAAHAFQQRTGREPVGQVQAECDFQRCVAPGHVEDEPGRQRLREQLRAVKGSPARPAECRHGHDQATHGRYDPDGTPYCTECTRLSKRAQRAASTDHTN